MKLTTQDIIERCKEIHGNKFDYSNTIFINWKTKIEYKCNSCDKVCITLPSNHLHGNRCKTCQYKLLPQNIPKSHNWFVEKSKAVHGDKFEYLEDYINKKIKIKIKCKTCGNIFEQRPSSHMEGRGCKKCQYKVLPQNKPIDINVFEQECSVLHKNKYTYFQDYSGGRNTIKVECPKHGLFEQVASSHLTKGHGCPKCSRSKGEEAVEEWLQNHNFTYETEKRFPDCINKHPLPFDFYLQNDNICIEFDGEQHTKSVHWFGKEQGFEYRINNDKIKSDYCSQKGINLIRISCPTTKNVKGFRKQVNNQLCQKLKGPLVGVRPE